MECNISGIYFILFISFVQGLSDSPRGIRRGRSLSDALVFVALSESPRCPEPSRYVPHPMMKSERITRWPPRQEKITEPKMKKKKPDSGDGVPDVEIIKSVEMEFDAALHRLVPVKETPAKPPAKSKKPKSLPMGELPLLTEKTFTDLREIILKFENEKRLRNRGLSDAKNFQTGSFKLAKYGKWKRGAGGSPNVFAGRSPLRSGGRDRASKVGDFGRPGTGYASPENFAKVVKLEMPVGGRVAGKIGYISGSSGGRSYTGINEEIIWTCIGMSITIAVLITMGLCYLAREKCRKRTEYYINA